MIKFVLKAFCVLAIAASLSACISAPIPLTAKTAAQLQQQPPVRFLLTFDDGPSASTFYNPSITVLDSLADNPLQPGIKAVFFVQTGATGAGNSDQGRAIMHRQHEEGHLLGFHTATPHHTNHRSLSDEELEQSLTQGCAIIASITVVPTTLLRPPFWNYDKRTFSAYQRHHLQVLLTDLSANDGKIWGYNFSLRRRSNMVSQLSQVRERIAAGELPAVDGVIPVVVTFHDLNRYTARHAREYLQILVDSAGQTGVRLADKPFYDDSAQLQRAALARRVKAAGEPVSLPGAWSWIWDHNAH
ncbi:polysaccharide deacetylase family protein [Pseudomonas syringae]|uniref:polysaccharide deacetylase family protein n=1 Tax=Pseudomonas syringae TaxID=317 RepID=UPI0018E6012A|nr:polysaccharide deacetylase family protein [Pseudomonas syringae]MBI6769832.1 polysaccharide deacetylase family protein [Pseudomonas syringae]MBI6776649.1 polysaccharide deacetylase family protein [Pseudomonas syringae]MBI6789073.1 polysaccharide deacetylase family protein [Pseudomonas syringae]MBI6799930.1 polysaccharide deacetylase family protein [Pseudomonas syringae]